jgi:hypothetical protein
VQEPGPASIHETGPIPAIGIPAKYQQECTWGDVPIYCCQHCRDNGTFDPSRFNFHSAEELLRMSNKTEHTAEHHLRCEPREFRPAATQGTRGISDKISGPFLSDLQVRRILEGWDIPSESRGYDPVNEAFSRGHLGKGRPGVENRRVGD